MLALLFAGALLLTSPDTIPPDGFHLQAYDDAGVPGRQPHIPADTSFEFPRATVDGPPQARTVAFGDPDLAAVYDDLDPAVPYALAVTYASEQGNPRRQRLAAGEICLHPAIDLPEGGVLRKWVPVPPEAIVDGVLRLRFVREAGPNAVVSVIELYARLPEKQRLRLEAAGGLRGEVFGSVTDLRWQPCAGARVEVANGTGDRLADTFADGQGAFRFDGAPWREQPRDTSLVVTATLDAQHDRVTLPLSELVFEPPVIRPEPTAQAQCDVLPLAGTWRFAPKAPRNFPAEEAETWDTVEVPGQWLQQGFTIPNGQTTALQRTMDIPETWRGRRVFLHFDAVHGEARYWFNGEPLGTTDRLFLPVQFEVTGLVNFGATNTLDLTLTSGSTAERLAHASAYAHHDLSGIPRDVRLIARPNCLVEKFTVVTDMRNSYQDGRLRVAVRVNGSAEHGTPSIVAVLRTATGNTVAQVTDEAMADTETQLVLDVSGVNPWTAETPYCYDLTLDLMDGPSLLERHEQAVGFRELRVESGELLVNGRPVTLAGVNRHEVNPLTGRADTARHALVDAQLFKSANVNYVRTSHYPPTRAFLDACDRVGLYVEVEAPFCWTRNMRAHEEDPRYAAHFVEPTVTMVNVHGNHPSVVLWSLGNESGRTPQDGETELPANYQTSLAWCREADPTRPTCFNNEWAHDGQRCEVAVLHYQQPPFTNLTHLRDDPRPILLDEYWHTVVYQPTEIAIDPGRHLEWTAGHNGPNSDWNRLMATPRVLGGAVWAGIDEEFYLPDGTTTGYGAWGIIDGWRRKKPEWWLIKRVYAPAWVPTREVGFETGQTQVTIPVENRYTFTDLAALEVRCEVRGIETLARVACAPGESARLEVAMPSGTQPGDLLELRFLDKHGALVNAHGVWLGGRRAAQDEPAISGVPGWSVNDDAVEVRGDDFAFRLKRDDTTLEGIALTRFPTLHITRKEQGFVGNITSPYEEYPDAGTRTVIRVEAHEEGGQLIMTVHDRYERFEGSVQWRLDASGHGAFSFDYAYNGPAFPVREVGLRFDLPRACQTLTWERDTEWDVYPNDHIGRPKGRAVAFANGAPKAVRSRPAWPWHLDTSSLGTRDFRATKYRIRRLQLASPSGPGVRVRANGDVNARASMHDTGAHLHLTLCSPPAIEPGARLRGSFRLQIGNE